MKSEWMHFFSSSRSTAMPHAVSTSWMRVTISSIFSTRFRSVLFWITTFPLFSFSKMITLITAASSGGDSGSSRFSNSISITNSSFPPRIYV